MPDAPRKPGAHHRGALLLLLLFLFASTACSEPSERSTASSPEPTAAPEGTPEPSPSPGTPVAAGCVAEDPTSLSETWTTLPSTSGPYSFAYPADWEDVSGDIGATADELLAEETLEELGLTTESIPGDFVQDPASGDNVGAFAFGDVDSTLEVIVSRQRALFDAIPAISVAGLDAEACLAGEPGLGLELSAEVTGEGQRYQKLIYAIRDGGLVLLYIDASDPASEALFDEVVRTWEWSEETEGA